MGLEIRNADNTTETILRVTVDVDGSELVALRAFYNGRFRYSQTPRIYRTGHNGVHLVWRDLPLSWEEAGYERALLHDDESRILLDVKCVGKPSQTLFLRNLHGSERVEIDERALLALPQWLARFVTKTRTRG